MADNKTIKGDSARPPYFARPGNCALSGGRIALDGWAR